MLPPLPVIGPATETLLRLVQADPDAAVYADDADLWEGYVAHVQTAYADAADHDRTDPLLFTEYRPPAPWSEPHAYDRLSPAALEAIAAAYDAQALASLSYALSVVCARRGAALRLLIPAAERRAAEQAERLTRLRRPPQTADRLPPDWLDRARLVPLAEVLAALGVETARGRWRGCPACAADVDGTRRGIVAPFRDGWVCNACHTAGDALTWAAFAVTGQRRPTADVGRWYAARWNLS